MEHVMAFCRSRTDSDGFMRERPGDWIFIDWAPMDKTGAVCVEKLFSIQAILNTIITNIQFLTSGQSAAASNVDLSQLPSVGIRMAMAFRPLHLGN
ncbi:hypothetical protein ADH70_011570 [Blautia pseudococcoides]|uniref:Uncharacterized protein n=2 Tax=Blautia pseudococcoides TaxID=1796616 RepID=A0A1C7ICH5_9FIRM|nr:hypothetical protein [uncultured Blautia sp.]ANU76624.1 hypothetical protein A4V09_13105 [Blautia pseudococcoides]ASU29431.1 hypothetical protein ADH70_011570 [Blautia pseudococcoides]